MTQGDEGYSHTPRSLVEDAAALAMERARIELDYGGARLKQMVVLIYAENVPEGQLDCTTAAEGVEDGEELLGVVFSHFAGAAKAMGTEVKIAPLGRG